MFKVVLKGFIEVPERDLSAVLLELPAHIHLTKAEEGCLAFEVVQDESKPNRFSVYEEFVDQEAFDRHQTRVRNSKWGAVTTNVARHYEILRE